MFWQTIPAFLRQVLVSTAVMVTVMIGGGAAHPAAPGGSSGSAQHTSASAPQQPTDPPVLVATTPDLPPQAGPLVATAMVGANGEGRRLNLPPGFQATIFATVPGGPRFMALSPDGHVFVTLQQAGQVDELVDHDNGFAHAQTAIANLNVPHGIAFYDGYLYVGETNQVDRFPYSDGAVQTYAGEVVVPNLPTGGHSTRTVDFGPDGRMYLAVGSSCNVCIEPDPRRAAISVFDADGGDGDLYATGLRNAVGFTWQQGTGDMWTTVNGRDNIGLDMGLTGDAATRATDELPPDYVTRITAGGNYGWPQCYGDHQLDPRFGNAGFCATTLAPTVELQPHSAPLGLAFYTGANFPADYQGDLFVADHGSWNRSVPTGHKIVRIHFENSVPVRAEDFATTTDDAGNPWGRPCGLLVAPDGALLVADDDNGIIYRIIYAGG